MMIQNRLKNISLLTLHRRMVLFSVAILSCTLLGVGGCSTSQPRYQARVPMTPLPEIRRPQVQRPVRVAEPKPPVATVQRYSDKPKQAVITQREVQSVLQPQVSHQKPENIESTNSPQQNTEQVSEKSPYEGIPENEEQSSKEESSPAVKSLMIRARADMAIGREQSAISKLERALRIESNNAELWFLLAKAHQSSSGHQQAITMAKKAISFAGGNNDLVAKSWKLIQKSGEASGDTMVVKEAINYSKVNP